MSGYTRLGNNLFDPITGALVGVVAPDGTEALTAAAPTASRRYSRAASKQWGYLSTAADIADFTHQLVEETPAPWESVRAHILNPFAATFDVNVGLHNPANVTLSATGALPAALAYKSGALTVPAALVAPVGGHAMDLGVLTTPWQIMNSTARDDGGSFHLGMIRVYLPLGTAHGRFSIAASEIAAFNAYADRKIFGWQKSTDGVGTEANFTGASSAIGFLSPGSVLEYRFRERVLTMAVVGDSTLEFSPGTTIRFDSFVQRVCAQFTATGVKAMPLNIAASGETSASYYAQTVKYLTLIKPSMVWYQMHSVNDFGAEAAGIAGEWSRMVQLQELCESLGILFGVISAMPSAAAFTVGKMAQHTQAKAKAAAEGTPFLDRVSVLGNADGTWKLPSPSVDTADNIHPTTVATIKLAAAAYPLVSRLF